MSSVFIVSGREDCEIARVVQILTAEKDIEIQCVRPKECGAAADRADLILLDCTDEPTVNLCRHTIAKRHLPFIALVAQNDWRRWSRSVQSADDFVHLPVSECELRARIHRILDRLKTTETDYVVQEIETARAIDAIIGDTPALNHIKAILPTIAACHASVLITGETGTGKELVARNLHYLGRRASGPFLAINCGAIPLDLFESELFGHSRGAFTGAVRDRAGYLAQANGGTLFLDEIDAMPAGAQVKLLRSLQTGTYRPVGCEHTKSTDVRVVAATNSNLREMVEQGHFRCDLYYRVNVLQIHLPPLRERPSDIGALAAHFLRRFAREYGTPVRRLAPDALDALSNAGWPGNVRELENVIHRTIVLSSDDPIRAASLTDLESGASSTPALNTFSRAKRMTVEKFECSYIMRLLETYGGNITQAAIEAGTNRRVLSRLIKRYHLEHAARTARERGTRKTQGRDH